MHSSNIGLGRSARAYSKHASRAVVASVVSLIESFDEGDARVKDSTVGAQKTGIVWECCEKLKVIPQGNRNAMRRDLFKWLRDCNDTMEEFQGIVDLGPEKEKSESNWDDFCNGTDEKYTSDEIPIAQACLAILKCSRGTINGIMKSCDELGDVIDNVEQLNRTKYLLVLATMHENAREIGIGATDLGCLMYPPLNLEVEENNTIEIVSQIRAQTLSLINANNAISSLRVICEECQFSDEVVNFSTKLLNASIKRFQEAMDAINRMC